MKFFFLLFSFLSFEIYSQSWQVVGEMDNPVHGGEAVTADSVIYIIGGFSVRSNNEVNYIQEYNPVTGTWRILDTLVTARSGFVAGSFSDSIVIAGGTPLLSDSNASIEIWNRINAPYVYGSENNSLRSSAAGLVKNNILYIFGGIDLLDTLSTYMYEYDILSDSIVFSSNLIFSILSMPFHQSSALLGDSIYLFGGGLIGSLKTIYRYNVVSREFINLPRELIQSRAGNRAVTLNENEIYIIGGFNETNAALSSVEIFINNETGDSILSGPSLNFPRREFMAVSFDNAIYVFGGLDDNDLPVTQIEKLDLLPSTSTEENGLVSGFKLNNNFPNPFNPSTIISYRLPVKSFVSLKVYDFLGAEVASLVNEIQNPGSYSCTFVPTGLSSGVYFYKISVSDYSDESSYRFTEMKKMIYLK